MESSLFATPLRDDAELRALEPHHAEEFLAHLDRARTHIAPWVGASFVASDLEAARAVLQRYAEGQAADRQRLYGIWLDGTLRAAIPGPDGHRRDKQIWSVLATEWPQSSHTASRDSDAKAELDQLTRTFLGAFTNTGGARPNLELIREVFIPEGTIISNVGANLVIYDLDAFITLREKMLTDGTLTEFSEWEVAERTEIFGSIAHRFTQYRKSGFLNGEWFEGSGHKTVQFVRTPAGWKMSSMAWDDIGVQAGAILLAASRARDGLAT